MQQGGIMYYVTTSSSSSVRWRYVALSCNSASSSTVFDRFDSIRFDSIRFDSFNSVHSKLEKRRRREEEYDGHANEQVQ
jgi:hypothetical protein